MTRSPSATAIDWEGLKRRLAQIAAAFERAGVPSDEEKRRILRARAQRLAQEPEANGTAGEQLEVVEFVLAHERYAVETTCVREVVPLRDLTTVPCTPPFVMGLVNVRGQILSVIDIKKFFELPEAGLGDLNKVIILDDGVMEFGVLADAIVGVHRLSRDEIQPALPTLTGIRADYLLGMTADRLVVLDAGKLLADPGLVVDEDVRV